MNVRFELDQEGIKRKQAGLNAQRQPALDVQVLKDSNYFIPKDEGTLEASGVIASSGGKLEWTAPYARDQYYNFPNKSTDTNPNARMQWFEAAKSIWLDLWLKIAGASKK